MRRITVESMDILSMMLVSLILFFNEREKERGKKREKETKREKKERKLIIFSFCRRNTERERPCIVSNYRATKRASSYSK
jgi:hypothetical protein